MSNNDLDSRGCLNDPCACSDNASTNSSGVRSSLSENVRRSLVKKNAIVTLVEDNELLRTAIQRVIKKSVADVLSYEDPTKALDAMYDSSEKTIKYMPHFVLTDLQMPHMTGDVFLNNLDSIYDDLAVPHCKRPSYAVMTSDIDSSRVPRAGNFLKKRNIPVFEKPFNGVDLNDFVMYVLMHHPRVISE